MVTLSDSNIFYLRHLCKYKQISYEFFSEIRKKIIHTPFTKQHIQARTQIPKKNKTHGYSHKQAKVSSPRINKSGSIMEPFETSLLIFFWFKLNYFLL